MIRVFAPGAAPPSVTLTPDESHHLVRVLRARSGDPVIVFDGRGGEWDGQLAAAERDRATIASLVPRTPVAEPAVAVVLGIALLKGDQMDQVVRDATMLGAAAIQPVITSHVALPERARTTRNLERWTRVAIASAKQSGRATVPDIRDPIRFETLLDASAPVCEAIVICVEPGRGGGAVGGLARPRTALVLVGPEGGWADAERARAASAGAVAIELGPRTLRAETAPVVALSALWTEWGWQ